MSGKRLLKSLLVLSLAVISLLMIVSCCTSSAEAATEDTFTGFREENGGTRYYLNGVPQTGWFQVEGKTYYATYFDQMVVTSERVIGGKFYVWNEETGLEAKNGFFETDAGTICYENGRQVTGWRHKDGSSVTVTDGTSEQYDTGINGLYYFLYSSGLMVTDNSYTIGGYTREFNADHTVKPLNGYQTRNGQLYLYENGVRKTGWYTDPDTGLTYYFQSSDAKHGQAANRWMYIGNEIYYFYASTSENPYSLKTSGSIGGIDYTYDASGKILYNGFINCEYANAGSSNSATNIRHMGIRTRYYKDGEMQTDWQVVDGKYYYFYALGSENGEGYMCCKSSITIDGKEYVFSFNGELKSDPPEDKLPDNLLLITDQRPGHQGVAVIDLNKIDLSKYDTTNDYGEIPEEAEIFRYTGSLYDVAGVKIRKSDMFGGYVILVAYGAHYAAVISYPDGKLLYDTAKTGRGPHSVELLPEGWLVVAAPGNSSNSYADGCLTFHNADPDEYIGKARLTVTLPNAHGVLYDPEENCIWAAGSDILRKYSYNISGNTVTVKEELSINLPSADAHDLAAYYGDTDKLIVTAKSRVYVYSKSENVFTRATADPALVSASRIKGYGILQDGSVVYSKPGAIKADSVSQTWLTDCIFYYKKTDSGLQLYRLVSNTSEFYKIRVMRAEYQ